MRRVYANELIAASESQVTFAKANIKFDLRIIHIGISAYSLALIVVCRKTEGDIRGIGLRPHFKAGE